MRLLKAQISKALSFNSSRYRLLKENESFAKKIPNNSLVLDAGAGDAPYKSLFNHTQYETADINNSHATYECDLKSIPVEDNRYDFIVFNQVMEHLPEPSIVLSELHRILKPKGKMIYSGPLFYEEHQQPIDYYRYTQFGLQHMFSKAGFVIEQLDWLEGYYGTVGYQLNCMTRYLPVRPNSICKGFSGYILSPFFFIMKILFGVLSIFFHFLETKKKYNKQGYPKNYLAIVRKN